MIGHMVLWFLLLSMTHAQTDVCEGGSEVQELLYNTIGTADDFYQISSQQGDAKTMLKGSPTKWKTAANSDKITITGSRKFDVLALKMNTRGVSVITMAFLNAEGSIIKNNAVTVNETDFWPQTVLSGGRLDNVVTVEIVLNKSSNIQRMKVKRLYMVSCVAPIDSLYYGRDNVTQPDAVAACTEMGKELFTIESETKREEVDKLIRREREIPIGKCWIYWVALYRDGLGEAFHWSDGNGPTDYDYIEEVWGPSRPQSNSEPNITRSYYSYGWGTGDDGGADLKICYICQDII